MLCIKLFLLSNFLKLFFWAGVNNLYAQNPDKTTTHLYWFYQDNDFLNLSGYGAAWNFAEKKGGRASRKSAYAEISKVLGSSPEPVQQMNILSAMVSQRNFIAAN